MMYICVTEPIMTQTIHFVHYIVLHVYSECHSWLWRTQNIFKILHKFKFHSTCRCHRVFIRSMGNHRQVLIWFLPSQFFVLFLVFLCSVMQSGIQRKCGREQGKSGSLQRDVQILEYFRIWVSIRKDSFCFSFSKSDSISCEASLHASDTLRTWILSVKLGGHPKVFLQKLWSWFKSHLLPWWVCCLY